MKIRLSLCLAILSLAVVGFSQDEAGLKKSPKHAPIAVSNAPVTEAESEATFQKLAGLMKTVTHISVKASHASARSTAPVTKSAVIAELMRFYKASEQSFTNTPRRIRVELSRITSASGIQKKDLIFLIHNGFVGNYGPLATGKASTLTPAEFGDTIGFFLTQLCQCTNTSSTKWTPWLRSSN